MDCSVQYTVSGARPKQEIRERGNGMDTIPLSEKNQLDEMELKALNVLRYCVGNSVYTSFVSLSKTPMQDDSRWKAGGRRLEDSLSARQAAAEADRSKRYLHMLDHEGRHAAHDCIRTTPRNKGSKQPRYNV